ncbi:phosphopantetheine-binding protein [Oscillospiraceae bacterium LCP25S3_E3]|nr:phosphopantetheine-binding protein [Oscillospiraceae bacterium]
MDKFPLSANGKITQKLFPKPIVNTSKETAIVKPSTETEQKLYEKWKNILNTEDFGVTDDFYSVGGDSLKAVQLLSELNADKEIDIRHFFDGSNIRDIAAYLDSENIDIA